MRRCAPLTLAVFLAVLSAGVAGCQAPGGGGVPALRPVENPHVPPPFAPFLVQRPDGSGMPVFVAGLAGEGRAARPLVVYLSGSGASSHFSQRGERVSGGLLSVLAQTAGEDWIVAATEKRGVAFGKSQRGIDPNTSVEYTTHATIENRVSDTRLLLDALLARPTVDRDRVLQVGHSEGADVAAAVAAVDPRVTHVAFLAGGGPSQMFDLIVLQRREMQRAGKSPAEIDAAVEALERTYREIMADPDSVTEFFEGHAYRRWASFFRHAPAEDLIASDAALFVAHGSEDRSGPIESFDYLVVELIRAGRQDVVIRRYPNRDHGFRDVDNPGEDPPLADVFAEVLEWAAP